MDATRTTYPPIPETQPSAQVHLPPMEAEIYQHYQVLRRPDGSLWELGRGSMGVTYKAFDTSLRCYVALKVISAQHLHSEMAGQRFIREARVAAQLRHRNIAAVYHLGVEPQGFFYSMEFIDGETLEDLVGRVGPLSLEFVLRIGLQVARALAVASRQGLIHRDIKPANVMVLHRDEEGEERLLVKVIDFGLARSYEPGDSCSQLTATGFVGTPLYASPEQLEEKDLDVRSDIYSLGITLWILLTGRPPFEGKMTQVITHHLVSEPPWCQLGDCPEPARALLERMLKKNPADRFQTATELRQAIEVGLRPLLGQHTFLVAGTDPDELEHSPTTTPLAKTDAGLSRVIARSETADPTIAGDAAAGKKTAKVDSLAGTLTASWRRIDAGSRVSEFLRQQRGSPMRWSAAAMALLALCAVGFLYWHGPASSLDARPLPARVEPEPTPPLPVQMPSTVQNPPVPEAEQVSVSDLYAEKRTPENSVSEGTTVPEATVAATTPSSFLLTRPEAALDLPDTSAGFSVSTEDDWSEPAPTWPRSFKDLTTPETPGGLDESPLSSLVASASSVDWDAPAENEEEDDEPTDSGAIAPSPTKAKAKARSQTRSHRSSRSARAPQPNFFQKLFGIKPKPKPRPKSR